MNIANFLLGIESWCDKKGSCECLYSTKDEVFLCEPLKNVISVTLRPGREVCTSALNKTQSIGTYYCPELNPDVPPSQFPDYCIRRKK